MGGCPVTGPPYFFPTPGAPGGRAATSSRISSLSVRRRSGSGSTAARVRRCLPGGRSPAGSVQPPLAAPPNACSVPPRSAPRDRGSCAPVASGTATTSPRAEVRDAEAVGGQGGDPHGIRRHAGREPTCRGPGGPGGKGSRQQTVRVPGCASGQPECGVGGGLGVLKKESGRESARVSAGCVRGAGPGRRRDSRRADAPGPRRS